MQRYLWSLIVKKKTRHNKAKQNKKASSHIISSTYISYKMTGFAFNRPGCHLQLERFYPMTSALLKQDYINITLERSQISMTKKPSMNTMLVFSFKIYIPETTLSFDFLSAEITKKSSC